MCLDQEAPSFKSVIRTSSTILVRVDGAHHLGMGHVIRCIALCSAMRQCGIGVTFVIRDYDDRISNLIRTHAFDVELVDSQISLKDDASRTAAIAEKLGVDCILTDLSHSDNHSRLSEYYSFYDILLESNRHVVVVDDIEKIDLPFDVQIIPYYETEHLDYIRFDKTKYLLGCSYFIVSEKLARAANSTRVIRPIGTRVLVSIGGSDPTKMTPLVANAIARLSRPEMEVKFICWEGFSSDAAHQIEAAMQNYDGVYELCSSQDISEFMLWCDILVSAGGLTKYEAALTGTPDIIISGSDLEMKRADRFAQSGCAFHIGHQANVHADELSEIIELLSANHDTRLSMSNRGKAMIDGKGTERIINQLPVSLPQ
ncbi:MAG: hypothetical protein HOC20_09400 [Chloroflexi bacterium]|jgi:UDP-2,4-diacetamido-2,4,6-trideoxy-beta-L-altropyranose hydrolase|nr:hypothetical protein [Chloroflexota bacterium]